MSLNFQSKKCPIPGQILGVFENEGDRVIADDLGIGGIQESKFIYIAVIGDAHFGEAGATRESTSKVEALYLRHRWWDGDAREAGAARESTQPNPRHRFWYGDAREARATRESIPPNLRHRWGDDDTREARATRESTIANLRHRWGDGDAREAGAIHKSIVPYLLYPLR